MKKFFDFFRKHKAFIWACLGLFCFLVFIVVGVICLFVDFVEGLLVLFFAAYPFVSGCCFGISYSLYSEEDPTDD